MARSSTRQAPTRVAVVKPDETKRERFVRLINQRTRPVIKYLRMIGKMANGGYDYTSEDLDKVEKVLHEEVTAAINALRRPEPTNEIDKIL